MHCLPVDVECQATVVLCGGSRHVLLVQHQPTGDPIVVQCLPATKRPSVQCGGSARGGRGSAGARANLADHVRGCGCGLGLVVVWWCWVGGLLGVVVIWQDKAGRAPVPYLGCLFCPPLPQRCLPFAPKVSPLCPKGVSPLPKRRLPFAQKASPLCPKGVSPLPKRCLPLLGRPRRCCLPLLAALYPCIPLRAAACAGVSRNLFPQTQRDTDRCSPCCCLPLSAVAAFSPCPAVLRRIPVRSQAAAVHGQLGAVHDSVG